MTVTMDTYSPTLLGKYLNELELKGLEIVKIESPSIVFDSKRIERFDDQTHDYKIAKKDVLIDKNVILTFNNGKKVGFDFPSASHVFIHLYEPDYEMNEVRYEKDKPSVSDIFPEVIGKTVADFKIYSTKDIMDLVYNFHDDNFNEDQDEFITAFNLIFTDNSQVGFQCDMDYTIFHYEE